MYNLPELNLPSFDIKTQWKEGNLQVWDPIRKLWVVLTPEEWVRQHFIHLLTIVLHYPRTLIKVESSLRYDRRTKRSDIQVMKPDGTVYMLVECKAPDIQPGDQTLKQLAEYNRALRADYLAITNGLVHFVWQFVPEDGQYRALRDFPGYRG